MGRAARHDILAIGLVRDATTLGSLAFGRHVLAGEIADLEVEAARLLIPHLCRAVAISKLLDAKSVVAAFETALDTLDVAVILTTADMRIVHANTAAKEMLRSRDPCVLHVLPLNHGELRPGLAPSAVAAIFVAPAVAPPPAPAEAMAALLDLTAAEARVLAQIAAGKTIVETAEALGIEVTTTKTHLAHIFDKTDTRRQADLVRLSAALSLPLRP